MTWYVTYEKESEDIARVTSVLYVYDSLTNEEKDALQGGCAVAAIDDPITKEGEIAILKLRISTNELFHQIVPGVVESPRADAEEVVNLKSQVEMLEAELAKQKEQSLAAMEAIAALYEGDGGQ